MSDFNVRPSCRFSNIFRKNGIVQLGRIEKSALKSEADFLLQIKNGLYDFMTKLSVVCVQYVYSIVWMCTEGCVLVYCVVPVETDFSSRYGLAGESQQSAADSLTCHIRVISTLIKYNGGRITKLIINVTVITTPEA